MFKDENDTAKKFTMFSNYIKNVPLKEDEIMRSSDTNISIVDTLNIFQNYVNNDDQFNRKTPTLSTTTQYTFNSKFYQKTSFVAVEGPVSSTKTDTAQKMKFSIKDIY